MLTPRFLHVARTCTIFKTQTLQITERGEFNSLAFLFLQSLTPKQNSVLQIMESLSRSTVLFLLFCIMVLLQFEPAFQDAGQQNVAQNEPEHPFLPKFLMDSISVFKRSHKSSWEKIKAVVHDLQTQFSPPNLE